MSALRIDVPLDKLIAGLGTDVQAMLMTAGQVIAKAGPAVSGLLPSLEQEIRVIGDDLRIHGALDLNKTATDISQFFRDAVKTGVTAYESLSPADQQTLSKIGHDLGVLLGQRAPMVTDNVVAAIGSLGGGFAGAAGLYQVFRLAGATPAQALGDTVSTLLHGHI